MRSRYHIREGIILRRKSLPSGDVVVTLLSEAGKWRGIAKKGKRLGGNLGKLSLFHDVTVQHYHKNDDSLAVITQVQLNGALPRLSDPMIYPYAHLLAELTDVLSVDVHPGEQMYTYLTSALRGLVQHPKPDKVALVMSWKLLTQAGLAPRLARCQQCGSRLRQKAIYLDVAAGEVLCEPCQQGYQFVHGVRLEPNDTFTLSTILQNTVRDALEQPLTTSLFQWSLLARFVTYHAHTLDSMPVILGMASTAARTTSAVPEATPDITLTTAPETTAPETTTPESLPESPPDTAPESPPESPPDTAPNPKDTPCSDC